MDVRDTALAHVLALEKDEAGGQRIITSCGVFHGLSLINSVILTNVDIEGYNWQDWSMFINLT